MRRPAITWTLFAAGALLALGGLAWVTAAALDLDRREADARRRAEREEAVRLALWRMDSAVSPLLAAEATRPYFVWSAFYPAERAYTKMLRQIQPGRVRIASPLLAHDDPLVLLHFQRDASGEIGSPQVPSGSVREIAEATYVDPARLEERSARLDDLRARLSGVDLRARLPAPPEVGVAALVEPDPEARLVDQAGREMNARQMVARNWQSNVATQVATEDVRVGAMDTVLAGGALLLARRVRIGDEEIVQGLRLDEPAVRTWLRGQVLDLLPGASLAPVDDGEQGDDARRLATLPLRLVPGEVPVAAGGGWTPLRAGLVLAWAAVLLGAAGAAALLRSALVLGERRAAFVSAVTHELRTPLTTFRMYVELLAGGMVAEEKRARYLETLEREADRLGHLVENVLAYAGLERGARGNGHEAIDVTEWLERLRPGLTETAERAGMRLVIEADGVGTAVGDPAGLERIVRNLVDNAAKYAAGAADRRIVVRAARREGRVELTVRDFGPGIRPGEVVRLFQPFRKSAAEAASSAPGVGLGLALSRALARAMGGDLTLTPADPGTTATVNVHAGHD